MDLLLSAGLPIAIVWASVRYGPIPNRWRIREHPGGFAVFFGVVGFALGFFGPLILAPDANQGPLLGIFITGPIGFFGGLAWGLLRAARRRRQ